MSINYSDFLRRLQEERCRCQFTQNEMSRMLKIGQSQYCKAEKGIKRFSISEIQLMCDSEVDVYYIFTGKRSQGCYTLLEENKDFLQILSYIKIFKVFIEDKPGCCYKKVIRDSIAYLDFAVNPVGNAENVFWATRIYQGLTQLEMCKKINVDVKKLRALEGDRLSPDSELIFEMYKEFGVSPAIFLKNQKCIKRELCYLLDQLNSESRKSFLSGIDCLFTNECAVERKSFEESINT